MDNAIKISIIVPVYGVEKYIGDCIESICTQTWKNIEIILVDDGSEDRSGQICDEWAERDERIKVFHVKNGGQSKARNIGISHATGAYIGFVDGDDKVKPDMYETLLQLMMKKHAQIAESNFDGRKSKEQDQLEEGIVFEMSGKEAIRKQLDLRINSRYPSTSLWSKLFKTELLRGASLPEGKIHEEYAYLCEAFLKCEKYVYINHRLYTRTLRKDSTTAMKFSERTLDKLHVYRERNQFLKEMGEKELLQLSKEQEYVLMLHYYGEASKADLKNVREWLKREMLSKKNEITESDLPKKKKKQFGLFFISPWLYAMIKKCV